MEQFLFVQMPAIIRANLALTEQTKILGQQNQVLSDEVLAKNQEIEALRAELKNKDATIASLQKLVVEMSENEERETRRARLPGNFVRSRDNLI
jgi:cell division protein FtsB